jgi:beta-1,4-mannosyltransferase
VGTNNSGDCQIISIPTHNLRFHNPIFSLIYEAVERRRATAQDFSWSQIISGNLDAFHIHFPEHFPMNSSWTRASLRSMGLLAAMLYAKTMGVPIIWVAHNTVPLDHNNMGIYRIFMSLFFRIVDGIVFLSQSSMQEFRRLHPSISKPSRIIRHPAYEFEKIMMPPERHPVPVLGLFGDQKDYKGARRSVALFRDLVSARPGCAKLVIAGRLLADRDEIVDLLRDIPPGEVSWRDFRHTDDELVHAIAECDVLLLTYTRISNSGAAMLALSCGRPIITSDLPLFHEMAQVFGSAWVRVLREDRLGMELLQPTSEANREMLLEELRSVSIDVTAERLLAFTHELRSSPVN